MNLDQITEKLDQEIEQHPEKAFIIKSLVLIFFIIGSKQLLGPLFFPLISVVCFVYLLLHWLQSGKGFWQIIRENFTFFSAPSITAKEKDDVTPWVTYALIGINSFIYLFMQTADTEQFIWNNLICFPAEPNLFNYPLSFFTSMYLHGSFSHLFGNMCFLWATGTVVERRIGWKRFLAAYHASGLAGAAVAVIVYAGIMSTELHMLGASGAISGVMGVFIVRCYFKKMIMPIPLLGILPLNFNIKMNAFVVIGMFFAMDLKGGLSQLNGAIVQTGHWDHLGGMVVGFWMAYRMKLSGMAIEERHRELGSNLLDGRRIITEAFEDAEGFAGAEKSLLKALSIDPDNPDTLLELARLKSHLVLRVDGRDYYTRALRLFLARNAPSTTAVFTEFFNKYGETLEAEQQYRIASLLYREGNLDLACRTLEMLVENSETSEPLREKSCLMAAKLLEKMSLYEAAEMYYLKFTKLFPESQQKDDAQMRLKALRAC
jgi:membrane associated rhomboid family serine protease